MRYLAMPLVLCLLGTNAATAADARPAKWCGWWMRQQVWTDPGKEFNRAALWAKWGSPASPAPGVIVVYRHHVAKITSRDSSGAWIMRSGNDNHAVRERARSLRGAIAFRQ